MGIRTIRPAIGLVLAAVLSLALISCLPWQWEYLINASGRATQDDVRRHMGFPSQTKSLGDNGWVLTYRYEVSSSLVGRRGDMMGGARCIEYVLTFDARQVLRQWVRQPC